MNTREYIESGILEAYILGALTPDEEALVEANIAKIPELADELLVIEAAMQQYAAKLAVEPPAGLQEKIWDSIQASKSSDKDSAVKEVEVKKAKVIPFAPQPARRSIGWAYAAGLVALAGSIAMNVFFWNENKVAKNENAALISKNAELITKKDTLQNQEVRLSELVSNFQKEKNMMADTGTHTVVMHTVKPGHAMVATIYWSRNAGVAYVSVDGLPTAPRGMQYQLWVIQDGKPVDMGMISNELPNTPVMQKVTKLVNSGQAFAISLEKEGGSPTPTMENIYVMGTAS